jgi:hypothetical protein
LDNNMKSTHIIRPINVLVQFNNEDGEQVSRYPGYLTGGKNAMYVDDYGTLMFAEIEPTEDPDTYLDVTAAWTQLGNIKDGCGDMEGIIDAVANKLHTMTGYEFVAKVLVHVREDFDYAGAIIPNLLNEN